MTPRLTPEVEDDSDEPPELGEEVGVDDDDDDEGGGEVTPV